MDQILGSWPLLGTVVKKPPKINSLNFLLARAKGKPNFQTFKPANIPFG